MASGNVHMIRIKFEIMMVMKTIRSLFSKSKSYQNRVKWYTKSSCQPPKLRCTINIHTKHQLNSNSTSNSMNLQVIKIKRKVNHNNSGNNLNQFSNNRHSSNSSILLKHSYKKVHPRRKRVVNQLHNMLKRCLQPLLI